METPSELTVVKSESIPAALPNAIPPEERLAQAVSIANTLSSVIEQKNLYVSLSGRRHVLAEGWQVLANLMNVGLEIEWTRPISNEADAEYGWEARAIARQQNGQILGSAEAQCCRDEDTWSKRAGYALRSMAQTRATSRALRQSIGFIVKLSGFDATPAEEMGFADGEATTPTPTPPKRPAPPPPAPVPSDPTPPPPPAAEGGGVEILPAWLDEPLGFGKYKAKGWREFLDTDDEDLPDYLHWYMGQEHKGRNQQALARRCAMILNLRAARQ